MSLAYPVIQISITSVVALEPYQVAIGSVWRTGNVLFRAPADGWDLLSGLKQWALAEDGRGRAYVLYPPARPGVEALVIQPLDSRYCFEISPFKDVTDRLHGPVS